MGLQKVQQQASAEETIIARVIEAIAGKEGRVIPYASIVPGIRQYRTLAWNLATGDRTGRIEINLLVE